MPSLENFLFHRELGMDHRIITAPTEIFKALFKAFFPLVQS